jgi:hypothetical protein
VHNVCLSGAEATLLLGHFNVKVYKFTNEDNNHNGLEYKEGLIQDTKTFCPTSVCNYGIYCAYSKDYAMWFNYGDITNHWVYNVSFPPSSLVSFESLDKLKADQVILSNKRAIKDEESFWNNPKQIQFNLAKTCLNIIQAPKNDDLLLMQHHLVRTLSFNANYLKGTSEDVVLAALFHNPNLIKTIENPSREARRIALSQDGMLPCQAMLSITVCNW